MHPDVLKNILQYIICIYYQNYSMTMTKGILGIIACPMLEDELLYGITNDPEEKNIFLIENKHCGSMKEKMERKGISFRMVTDNEVFNRAIDMEGYSILIKMNDLALHSEPKDLKDFIENEVREMNPFVDAIGLYYGLCGNYGWDMSEWARENGLKPVEMFRDNTGRICDDCVGVSVGGGARYLELEKTYTGMFYVIPAIAHNWRPFMAAGDSAKVIASMDKEMLEAMGIHDDDSYIKWMFDICGYKNMVKMDTGLEPDREEFDREFDDLCKIMDLKPITIADGWMTIQPAVDIYNRSKGFLSEPQLSN